MSMAVTLRFHRWQSWLCVGFVLLLPSVALAHERFIKHDILQPLHREFFRRLDPNMVAIALRVVVVMAMILTLWCLRDLLDNCVENTLLRKVQGRPRQWV